jgi:hypothetical protein
MKMVIREGITFSEVNCMQQISIPRVSPGQRELEQYIRAHYGAFLCFHYIRTWKKMQQISKVEAPREPKKFEELLKEEVSDARKLLEMEKIPAMPLGTNPQPADQLKLIHSLQNALKDNLVWLDNEIALLDREQGDSATLEIFQENLREALKELQKTRRFGVLRDTAEIDIKGGAFPEPERFTDIQKDARIVTKYDQLTGKVFDVPNPLPAQRMLIIHSLHDAVKDDIAWLEREIEVLDKEFV